MSKNCNHENIQHMFETFNDLYSLNWVFTAWWKFLIYLYDFTVATLATLYIKYQGTANVQ